uniref:NADH-ubiquinone oxidoreductase chain 4L n=1 Tax=Chaetopterus variopedatus TaxID=34590 RepID=A0A0S2N0B0_CHAVR|nr:NADH dehydrogenase subunit 4L [Chaetopterus variopedatus]ALO81666.1 NADH dehydrogenase subunit 4L [Chaetopterus variopedatus]
MTWVVLTLSFAAFLCIIRNRFHLLIILLSLETLMLTLIVHSIISAYFMSSFFLMSLILLSMSACEASIGLAMLVMIIRAQGNDSMKVLSMQKL